MAITRFSPYKREEEIIEKLEKVQGGEWEKLNVSHTNQIKKSKIYCKIKGFLVFLIIKND